MRMVDLIEKKRDGGVLSDEEIRFIIDGFTKGDIPDYQMSAWAMAVFYKGMTDHETAVLTDAMMRSGDTIDLSRFGTKSVDKHSTGGVGDKTTLILAPIVSSLGGKMAKMSGRGLGHTGGTVDKLESIPGYKTTLSAEEFMQQVENVGVAVIGQSGNLTPADKKLYALRDVTATVDSLPLITSSIMSKKLAAGSHSIVLDVKVGSGAFMKTLDDATKVSLQHGRHRQGLRSQRARGALQYGCSAWHGHRKRPGGAGGGGNFAGPRMRRSARRVHDAGSQHGRALQRLGRSVTQSSRFTRRSHPAGPLRR